MRNFPPAHSRIQRLTTVRGFGSWSYQNLFVLFSQVYHLDEPAFEAYSPLVVEIIGRTRKVGNLALPLLEFPHPAWIEAAIARFGPSIFEALINTETGTTTLIEKMNYCHGYRERYIASVILLKDHICDHDTALHKIINVSRRHRDGRLLSRLIRVLEITPLSILNNLRSLQPWQTDFQKHREIGCAAFDAAYDPKSPISQRLASSALFFDHPHILAAALAHGDDLSHLGDFLQDETFARDWLPQLNRKLASAHHRLALYQTLTGFGGTREIFKLPRKDLLQILTQ